MIFDWQKIMKLILFFLYIKKEFNGWINLVFSSGIYNNGLAEGSVNKIKLIKRIMYGRNSFALLRSKILLNEYFYQNNQIWKEPIERLR